MSDEKRKAGAAQRRIFEMASEIKVTAAEAGLPLSAALAGLIIDDVFKTAAETIMPEVKA